MTSESNHPGQTRAPETQDAPVLGDIATLPVFYRLAGRRVVIAGGGRAAVWKAELLAATGAQVDVFAARPDARMQAVAAHRSNLRIIERDWQPNDFELAVLVIGETDDATQAHAMNAAARAAGAHLNVIDKPQWSSFQFGAMVERSPLIVAISTDGGAPVFGQAIRTRIETLLPDGLRFWARAAKSWRSKVTALKLDTDARRKIWERFARRALAEPDRAPADSDLTELMAAAPGARERPAGAVWLVGAGPGDPELLTMRAVRALQSADVVLFDDLVSPEVLALARREADKVSVGKRGFKPSCTQEDICELIISLAREGRQVVRLKGGDPMVFGRANEEIDALDAAGITVAVVPGVTAASAAAASLGLSLTERTTARRLQFVTAHARSGALPDDLNWPALADPLASTVVYMGVRTLDVFCAQLVAHGLPPDTPAMLVERASHADQRNIAGTVTTLPQLVADAGIKGPALTIVGAVARERNPAAS